MLNRPLAWGAHGSWQRGPAGARSGRFGTRTSGAAGDPADTGRRPLSPAVSTIPGRGARREGSARMPVGPGASCRALPAGAFPTSGRRPGVNHTPVASAMGPSLARTVTVTSLAGPRTSAASSAASTESYVNMDETHAVHLARHLADLYERSRFTDLRMRRRTTALPERTRDRSTRPNASASSLNTCPGAVRRGAVRDAQERGDGWQRVLPRDARA
jgi:hypothetical protein